MIDLAIIVDALRNAPNYNAGLGTSTLEDEAADAIEQLIERVRELEAERDAAVADLSTFKKCGFCVHLQNQQYCYKNCQRHVDVDNFRTHPCWEWRGPQAEEGDTE